MAASKGPGRGRLPDLKNLVSKSPRDMVRTLTRFGLQPDMVALRQAANRAFEHLDSAISEGVIPDAKAWEAIDKAIKTNVSQYLRQQTKAAIGNYKVSKFSPADKLTWISKGDAGVCTSCESRHGKTKTLAQWRALGMPRSAALRCKKECRCDLHSNGATNKTKSA